MQKPILYISFFFSLFMQFTAWTKALDWEAMEGEACILEITITACDQEFFPLKNLENKDPETKMPEKGFYTFSSRTNIIYFPALCLMVSIVHDNNCFSGFTNQANAP